MESKIDGLEERAAAMTGAAKSEFEAGIAKLRDQKKSVEEQLNHVEDMSVDAWTNMRGAVDSALQQLENSYQQFSATHEVK